MQPLSATTESTAPSLRGVLFTGNVFWLGIVSFLNDTASEMIYPLLPFFLLGPLGAGPAFLGLVEGVAESLSSFLKLASGWISDRARRRKPLVLWGYGVAAVTRPLIALASAPWHVLAIRIADRTGKGVRTAPRDALLAGSVPPHLRGTAFGFHRAADHAGAVLGPLIAAGLLVVFAGRVRPVFALAAIPGLLAGLALAWKVRDVADPAEPAAPTREPPRAHGQALGSRFYGYLVVLAVFTLGNATDAFLLLRAGNLGIPLAAVPLLWGAFHVSKMAWSVPGGMLADRFGHRGAIVAGWVLYALTYVAFAYATEAWHAWVLFLVYGLFYGLTEAPEKALVAALAPADRRGRAFGAYHFAIGIAALPASLLFGVIWSAFGPRAAFLTGASLALIAAIALPIVVHAPTRRPA